MNKGEWPSWGLCTRKLWLLYNWIASPAGTSSISHLHTNISLAVVPINHPKFVNKRVAQTFLPLFAWSLPPHLFFAAHLVAFADNTQLSMLESDCMYSTGQEQHLTVTLSLCIWCKTLFSGKLWMSTADCVKRTLLREKRFLLYSVNHQCHPSLILDSGFDVRLL